MYLEALLCPVRLWGLLYPKAGATNMSDAISHTYRPQYPLPPKPRQVAKPTPQQAQSPIDKHYAPSQKAVKN